MDAHTVDVEIENLVKHGGAFGVEDEAVVCVVDPVGRVGHRSLMGAVRNLLEPLVPCVTGALAFVGAFLVALLRANYEFEYVE